MEALDEAVELAGQEATQMAGRIRLTSTTAFGRSHILPEISKFMMRHPMISVDLELSDGFVDLVAGEFDFAVRAGILPENEYISKRLVRITPTVCATPEYFQKYGKPTTPQDIIRHRCIGMLSNPSRRVFEWEFADKNKAFAQPVEPVFVANDPEAVVLAAVQGVGLAQVGTNLVEPYLNSGKLVTALSDYSVESRGIYLVYPSKRFVPTRVRALMDSISASLVSDA
ncbi:MAG: substrate binding domain-containing protein [Pseudomonadota bacterium]